MFKTDAGSKKIQVKMLGDLSEFGEKCIKSSKDGRSMKAKVYDCVLWLKSETITIELGTMKSIIPEECTGRIIVLFHAMLKIGGGIDLGYRRNMLDVIERRKCLVNGVTVFSNVVAQFGDLCGKTMLNPVTKVPLLVITCKLIKGITSVEINSSIGVNPQLCGTSKVAWRDDRVEW